MSATHKTVTIDATAEKIFEFLSDPQNTAAGAPNVLRVVDIRRSERRVGDTFRVIYKVFGRTFDEKVIVTRCDLPPRATPHRRYQLHESFAGPMKGTLIWTLEAQDIQTEASVDVEYEDVSGVRGKGLNALLLKRTKQKSLDRMLKYMKLFLEGGIASRSS